MERSLERLEKRSPEGQVTWECPRGMWSGKLESPSVDGGRSKLTNSPPPPPLLPLRTMLLGQREFWFKGIQNGGPSWLLVGSCHTGSLT